MLKFWPVQQHGWSAQPPEAFFIELNSVSSVELVGRFEFQIVYEGRRRLMHLRAPSPELAVSWVESLRRAARHSTRSCAEAARHSSRRYCVAEALFEATEEPPLYPLFTEEV